MPQPTPEFEKSFADLAYSYINQNAPKLLDFMVGFQVLDHNDDESKAVGVFGFSVGGKKKEMFYAPVFFINGKLKGQELLYNGKADLFMPMEEAWVDFILNKKPIQIGKSGEPGDRGILARYLPNFRDMLGQGMSKAATEIDPFGPSAIYGNTILGKEFDITPAIGMFIDEHKKDIYKTASDNLDLVKLASESDVILKALAVRMTQYGEFTKLASYFHDLTKLTNKREAKNNKADCGNLTCETKEIVEDVVDMSKVASVVPTPVFLTDSDLCYTNAQKQEFIKHSYVIADERVGEQMNGVIDGDVELTNPSEPGIYDVVFEDLSIKECLVITAGSSSNSYTGSTMIVGPDKVKHIPYCRDKDGDRFITLTSDPKRKISEYKKFDAFKSGADNNSGTYTPVYLVNEYGKYWSIGNNTTIIESDRVFKVVESGSSLIVPKGKCYLLRTKEGVSRASSRPAKNSTIDITRIFPLSTHGAKMTSKGIEFSGDETIKVASTNMYAMKYLMVDQNLSRGAAEHVVKNASQEGYHYVIKQAARPARVDQYEPYAPLIDIDDTVGVDPYSGTRITQDTVQDIPVQGLLTNDQQDYGELEPDVFDTMRRAVSTDQKEVFDLTALNSLIEVDDVDNAIDKNLPDIVTAVDKIGRSLFLLYFHMDDFKERYGQEDLSDLEDTLKNALKTNGKLVLFLKKRSVSQDIDDGGITL